MSIRYTTRMSRVGRGSARSSRYQTETASQKGAAEEWPSSAWRSHGGKLQRFNYRVQSARTSTEESDDSDLIRITGSPSRPPSAEPHGFATNGHEAPEPPSRHGRGHSRLDEIPMLDGDLGLSDVSSRPENIQGTEDIGLAWRPRWRNKDMNFSRCRSVTSTQQARFQIAKKLLSYRVFIAIGPRARPSCVSWWECLVVFPISGDVNFAVRITHPLAEIKPAIAAITCGSLRRTTRTTNYDSVVTTTRTLRKSLLQEAAEVGASFDELNTPVVLTAEGELQSGSLPAVDQHALSVANMPRIRASDLDEHFAADGNEDNEDEEVERAESPTDGGSEFSDDADSMEEAEVISAGYNLHSQGSVNWESPEEGYIVPRITAKKKEYKWMSNMIDTQFKFFPTWFDLSEDEDQLGPLPEEC
ncbi:hypothetical protein C8R45DRAFT_936847 [Mycena sanguinolenta]|nr:hypothetical protein C8R45DRAFT_936847 [Mycena sanguinolenta]